MCQLFYYKIEITRSAVRNLVQFEQARFHCIYNTYIVRMTYTQMVGATDV